ncbi:MAG: HNH endonuclease signature motif containing protein, partial [Corynebacterium sp.]|nr:HNH endonuclease signature motif containing protein [Corynebacterium sp.]
MAYFRVQADGNLTGLRARLLNRDDCEFYRYHVQSVDFARADVGKLAAQLQADGLVASRRTIRRMLGFVYRLVSYFPKLATVAFEQGLISVPLACAMEDVLQDLPAIPEANLVAHLDSVLVRKFTPKRRGQHLPTPDGLRKLLELELREFRIIGQRLAKPAFWCGPSPEKHCWTVSADMDAAAAAMIERHVQARANAHKITEVEAFIQLLTGDAEHTTVTVFGLGAPVANADIRVDELVRTGGVTKQSMQRLTRLNIQYRTVFELAVICRASHDPGPILQAGVELRDGHCRYPGCTVPAHRCDIDHVINHNAGGWTCLANLQCLCRHHHNMKTDRKLRATITPDGAVTWFDTDPSIGEEHRNLGTTLPEGPLA